MEPTYTIFKEIPNLQGALHPSPYSVSVLTAIHTGELLNIHDLKVAYEKAIGHETSKSTVYNLLARHGWRKLMPRPFHPKRDPAAQDAFKKTAFQLP